ncbi:cytosolic carboxypeptidase 2 [Tympanuchus pallidicinctus]|uniref:cytosolic carboxypeptidase 2 n=1 Tax=Tympanuchus pallidicinctus TaxID=109042 RepID=UPI0022874D75|nr:cytosolic carboxypeptidase 2 [Tympanuchus pallidicinctus]
MWLLRHLTAQAVPEPYDNFMHDHLCYYGYFKGELRVTFLYPGLWDPLVGLQQRSPKGQKTASQQSSVSPWGHTECHCADSGTQQSVGKDPNSRAVCSLLELHQGAGSPPDHSAAPRAPQLIPLQGYGSLREPRALFALPSARGPLPAPRWPIECEVIKETIKHIEWIPPEPEPFCQPMDHHWLPRAEQQGTVVYQLSPVPSGSCFTRARAGGAPGPLSSPAATLEDSQDNTLLFESRFECGNLQKAVKVGPYEYVLTLRPDLYTAKHTQWFYFRVQNTRKDTVYCFTIVNLAKPKSLYSKGMCPLFYSQKDAQSHGIGWRRVGTNIRYYRGNSGEEPAPFCLSWSTCFPHDSDMCYFAHSYPYTYSDLQRYLRTVMGDPARSQYCVVRALCRSLAGNIVYLLTITAPSGGAAKRAVVLSARVHPGESGGSWAMQGFLDFILSAAPDAHLLRQLFVFKVVPMLNPDGVVVGNSRCSLAGRDPNRAYGTGSRGSFPAIWHLRAMVERLLVEQEVVLYCDFHGHSRKNNVFMYGCDGGRDGSETRLQERIFPLMLSKNAPDKFSFSSCKFKVQKSKEGTGRVVMWRMGIANSYTLEAAFGGSTLGGRNSHFTVEDLKSLGYHLCDTLLDFCDPNPAKFQQCLAEVDALLRPRLGSGQSWSDIAASQLESSTSGSDSSVSDGSLERRESPCRQKGQGARVALGRLQLRRRKRLRSHRVRNAMYRPNGTQSSHGGDPVRVAQCGSACHSGTQSACSPSSVLQQTHSCSPVPLSVPVPTRRGCGAAEELHRAVPAAHTAVCHHHIAVRATRMEGYVTTTGHRWAPRSAIAATTTAAITTTATSTGAASSRAGRVRPSSRGTTAALSPSVATAAGCGRWPGLTAARCSACTRH